MHSDPATLAPVAPTPHTWTCEEIITAQDNQDRTRRFLRIYKTIPRNIKKDLCNQYILVAYRAAMTLSKRRFARVAWPWLPTRPPQK
jgi:hypothetical protein